MPRMTGQISLFPYDFAPMGWRDCDGTILPISQNQRLFQLLGFTFGGDHQSAFAVPNLTAVTPKNCRFCISLEDDLSRDRYEGITGETFALPAKYQSISNLVACEGQSFTAADYDSLAMYMGDRFGGDGVNLKLPDLKGKPLATDYRYVICVDGNDPMFQGPREPFIGQLILLPFDETAQSLLRCDGGMVSVQQNTALYGVIGNRFGGDAQKFGLPGVSSAVPTNYNYFISCNGLTPHRP